MNKETEKQKEVNTQSVEKILEYCKKQYDKGIKVGAAAVSKIILKKLSDSSKSLPDRINEIKRFCKIPIKTAESIAENENKTDD